MATVQDFLSFLYSEDSNPASVVDWVKRNNFDINSEIVFDGINGRTALHWAAYRGEERIVRIWS